MKKLFVLLVCMLAAVSTLSAQHRAKHPFTVVEATLPEMRTALEKGRVTSRELVTQYLIRIALYEDKLNAVIAVNRDALREADALDRERAQHHVRGPLHG